MSMECGQVVPCERCPALVRPDSEIRPGQTAIMQTLTGFWVVSRSQVTVGADSLATSQENYQDTPIDASPYRQDIADCTGPEVVEETRTYGRWPKVLGFLNFNRTTRTATCPPTQSTKIWSIR